jgi:hypothetical protein
MVDSEENTERETGNTKRTLASSSAAIAGELTVFTRKNKARTDAIEQIYDDAAAETKTVAKEASSARKDLDGQTETVAKNHAKIKEAAEEILATSDAGGVTAEEGSRIKQLEKAVLQTTSLTGKAAAAAQTAARELIGGADFDLEMVADHRLPELMTQGLDHRESITSTFERLAVWAEEEEGAIRRKVAGVSNRQHSLVGHIQGRERTLQTDVDSAQVELERMLYMASKYQGPEAIVEMNRLLDAASNTSTALQGQVDSEVIPQTNKWRIGVGQILEYLGAGVDYDDIMRAAEEAFDKEQRLRNAASAASGQVDVYVRHAERIAEKALAEERRRLAANIRAVTQSSESNAASKIEKIRELNAKSKHLQQIMMDKARVIAHTQEGVALSLQQKQDLLGTLVERASRAGKQLEPPARFELSTKRELTDMVVQSTQDYFSDTPTSLLQEEETDGPASALLYGTNVTAGVNVSHSALAELEGERSREDNEWEKELQVLAQAV